MQALISLLLRIISGERYEKSSREDVILGLMLLSSLPVPLLLIWAIFAEFPNLSLFTIWLVMVGMGILIVLIFFTLFKVRSIPVLSIITLFQYVGLFVFIFSTD